MLLAESGALASSFSLPSPRPPSLSASEVYFLEDKTVVHKKATVAPSTLLWTSRERGRSVFVHIYCATAVMVTGWAAAAAARMGTGLPESGGFHPDLIFWEMLSSAVMLLLVAAIVASRITPIFFCSSFPGEKLMLSPYGRNKRPSFHLLGRADADDGLDVDVDAIGVLARRKKENILLLPESEQD